MISSEGITFQAARVRVVDTLNAEIKSHLIRRSSAESRNRIYGVLRFGQITIPCVIFSVAMVLTLILSSHRDDFMVGLLCSICVLVAVTAVTVVACHHYRENVNSEVINEIKRIVCDYLDELERQGENLAAETENASEAVLLSGNPHVSIVTVYRNMQWQRIPSLLLVDGDIIALMGGDVTPGRVQELLPAEETKQSRNRSGSVDEPNVFAWRNISDKVIGRGEKIRLRKSKAANSIGGHRSSRLRNKMSIYGRHGGGGSSSAAISSKQRIVSANSLELLQLSGDIRCFVLRETPIAFFCWNILNTDLEGAREHTYSLELDLRDVLPVCLWKVFGLCTNHAPSDEIAGKSFIRSLFNAVNAKSLKLLWWLLLLLLLTALIRFIIVPDSRNQWEQVVVIPIITISMCFFPLSFPLSLIIAEALTTASLLTSIEFSLKEKARGAAKSSSVPVGPDQEYLETNSVSPSTRPERDITEGSILQNQSASSHGSEEDEYNDEDIDERAEKSADLAYSAIYWSRLLEYIGHVGSERLSWKSRYAHDVAFENHFTSSYNNEPAVTSRSGETFMLSPSAVKLSTLKPQSSGKSNSSELRREPSQNLNPTSGPPIETSRISSGMLPVPFARSKLVETLGSITRVCFIDDDVICEGFSVTEEIFLLNSVDTVKGLGARSTMLDLHANAQAEGNRFEDPNWVKYLPSLKPMGLSALLTVDSTATLRRDAGALGSTEWAVPTRDAAYTAPRLPSVQEVESIDQDIDLETSEIGNWRTREIENKDDYIEDGNEVKTVIELDSESKVVTCEETKHSREDALNNFSSMLLSRQKNVNPSAGSLEHDLIVHVRNTMPSEVLRDLAQEIGFVEDDARCFTRLVEMNVLAPCLGNDRVVEDTHLWGQEQTRRRGTIVSSARAVVVDDNRGGAMQLMSHGAPPLILSYCREYWDGAHITHISSADRKEILDVYSRWTLEDFDVVAFGYSPLPISLTKMVHQVYNENAAGERAKMTSKTKNIKNSSDTINRAPTQITQNDVGVNDGCLRDRGEQTNCLFYVDPSTEGFMHLCAVSRDRHTFKLLEDGSIDAGDNIVHGQLNHSAHKSSHHHRHHRHHRRPQIQDKEVKNMFPTPLTKAYSIAVQTVHGGGENDPVMRADFIEQPSSRSSPTSAVIRSLSAYSGEKNFQHSEASHPRYLEARDFRSSSVAGSSESGVQDEPSYLCRAQSPSQLMDENSEVPISETKGDLNKLFDSNNSFGQIEDSFLVRNQSTDQLYGNNLPITLKSGMIRQRSNSFSAENSPERSNFAIVESEDIERGYHSDPSADVFLSPMQSSGQRVRLDSNYDSEAPSVDNDDKRNDSYLGSDNGSNENDEIRPEGSISPIFKDKSNLSDLHVVEDRSRVPALRMRRTTSAVANRRPENNQLHKQLSGNIIHHSTSDSYLLQNGGDGQHSAAALVETVFGLNVRSVENIDSGNAANDSENELVDIEAMSSADSPSTRADPIGGALNQIQETIPLDEPVVEEKSSPEGLCIQTNVDMCTDNAEGDNAASGSSSNVDLLSLDSNLIQFTPTGLVRLDASPHITLRRSASYDMASLTLAAMETDASLCDMNMKPLMANSISASPESQLYTASGEIFGPTVEPACSEVPDTSISSSLQSTSAGSRGSNKLKGSAGKPVSLAGSIWPFLHEQIFLGMAASSVPVRPEAPEVLEDLQAAGIRFVFFSPRNMRRSKRIAEKIGLQTDWNCAISLRDMEGEESMDPNRYEWDVKARLPHGVEAIKHHIRAVDNVPLLVSLFTDSTPGTIRQMINIFKDNGEVVMSVGCSYRAQNQDIFSVSDVGVSVATLPGVDDIPIRVEDAASKFQVSSRHSLCQADLLLVFSLIGVGTAPLLQVPFVPRKPDAVVKVADLRGRQKRGYTWSTNADLEAGLEMPTRVPKPTSTSNLGTGAVTSAFRGVPLRLPALLESVRKCRVFLLNSYQALGSLCVSMLSLALWPLFAQAIPISVPPVMPVPILLIFLLLHVPVLLLTMLFIRSSENVMKNTPRKRDLITNFRGEKRFQNYLFARAGYVGLSVAFIGWLASAAINENDADTTNHMGVDKWASRLGSFHDNISDGSFSSKTLSQYHHIQDVMSCQMLLGLIMQLVTMLERGQELVDLFETLAESLFLYNAAFIIVLHIFFLTIRAWLRDDGFHRYQNMRYDIWLAMVVLPLFGLIIGTVVNALDKKSYLRYMQFLRLEFDTKLGMHSPK